MSQFEEARRRVLKIDDAFDKSLLFDLDIARLRELVHLSQNQKPHGEGDGSIGVPTWLALRDLVVRAEQFREALDRATMIVGNFSE